MLVRLINLFISVIEAGNMFNLLCYLVLIHSPPKVQSVSLPDLSMG